MMKMNDRRRGFTMVEVLIAGLVAVFVLGSVTFAMSRLGRAKEISRTRYAAYMRADAALNAIRSDIASTVRSADLFHTRVRIYSDNFNTPAGQMSRDELLLFTNRLRPIRDVEYTGEGTEYESQFRIEEDEVGVALLQRRDPYPDEYPAGGGMVTPLAENIVGLYVEAYDGLDWYNEWESDEDGIPLAIRVTLTASGGNDYDELYESPLVTLRTVVALDRVPTPIIITPDPEEDAEDNPDDAAAAAADAAAAAGVDIDPAALEAARAGQVAPGDNSGRVEVGTSFGTNKPGSRGGRGRGRGEDAPAANPGTRGDSSNVSGGNRGPS